MFHHFHDDLAHKKGQGSISKDDFYKIIDEDLSETNLMNKIVDWCDIHSKKIPCKIYEKWKEMFDTAF